MLTLQCLSFIHQEFRFQTNADIPGVERLSIAAVSQELLTAPLDKIALADFCLEEDGALEPNCVFLVKGWSRSVAAITCMLHAYENQEAFQAPWCRPV